MTIYGKFLFNYVQLAPARTLVDGSWSPDGDNKWGQQMGTANGDRYLRPQTDGQMGTGTSVPIFVFFGKKAMII